MSYTASTSNSTNKLTATAAKPNTTIAIKVGSASVANGGTGASNAKAALSNLGIFYAASLPSTGTDGQICLVPV